eukprot:m.166306 g.166306  ORF g.166306 m.166306 type:complete len:349 (+) comp18153_c0_seq11:108-1154(+)
MRFHQASFQWKMFLVALASIAGKSRSGSVPISKSIDFYINFPGRVTDFLLGNNSQHWANTSVVISGRTRSVYQCCNGFLLGAEGKQIYSPGNDTWGQRAYSKAGKNVYINIDPAANATVTAGDICTTAYARRNEYAHELLTIATQEGIHGYILDWEDAVGNNVTCFNALWGFVSQTLKPYGLTVSASVDNSNHQGPMDTNSTDPWSTEWDWIGYVSWAGVLVDMGTYPGAWSRGLSYPAWMYLESKPCPAYTEKQCGIKGQILDMIRQGVAVENGQLSPGLSPALCFPNGTMTQNGWTEDSLTEFLTFLDTTGIRTVTLWFSNALQLYTDSFTCPWFMPTLLAWAERA